MSNKPRSREDRALVLALLRSHQLFYRTINKAFLSAGLTSSQWDVLETLHVKGAVSINELMGLILSTSGNLDVVIKNLIHAGFVMKEVDPKDRRSRIVKLTDAGKRKIRAFLPAHDQALAEAFGGLTIAEKRETIRILNRLRKQLTPIQEGN